MLNYSVLIILLFKKISLTHSKTPFNTSNLKKYLTDQHMNLVNICNIFKYSFIFVDKTSEIERPNNILPIQFHFYMI